METAKKYAEKLSGLILPYLLCAVMLSAALNIYTENAFDIYTAAAAVFAAALFALLEFLRKKKFGGLFYFGILILMGTVPNLILGRRLIFQFMQWFFSGGQAVSLRVEFAAVFIILFGFFFVSAVFYFTRVVYRSAAVILVSLIPFALAVKAVVTLDWKYPAAIAAINLFMFIYYGRQTSLETAKAAGGSSFMVYADFAAAAALLAMIIPKPTETPFYEQFESAINFLQFGGSGTSTVLDGDYSELSGNADAMQRGESVLLYFVRTDDPVYYKTQVFDAYDPAVRAWRPSGWVEGDKNWQDAAPLLSFEKLSAAIEAAEEENPEIYNYYPTAKAYEGIAERETYSIMYTRDFSAIYVLAPLRICGAMLSDIGAKYSCRSDNGEVFTNLRKLPQNVNYTVRYYSEDIFDELIQRGACDISFEDYGYLLSEVFLYSEFDSEESDIAYEFYKEYRFAEEYKEKTVTPVSEEIQSLADSLTAGLEYDYQKAAAIEAYFQTNGFVYSLAYEAPEERDTPEYFIFESKTGTCSDFATAYTLLARAAGLTVRYTEGFTTTQGAAPQPGIYYIYSENAHAYPEVYIPGAGWRVYEPTVAGGRNGGGAADGGETDYMAFVLTAIIAVAVFAVFILLVIFSPKIIEGLFRAGLLFSGNEKAVRRLYLRHMERLGAKKNIDPLPMTLEEAAALTFAETGISLAPIAEPLGGYCYGGKNIAKEERQAAYERYKELYKKLTQRRKRLRELIMNNY